MAMIEAAAERLRGQARVTPLLSSDALDRIAGRRVLVKAECLQHTGSFKFRGGYAAISALTVQQRARGVLAWSSGNHAQGVARAAALLGAPAVIVMPADAPRVKIDGTRALGAEVVLYDRVRDNREAIATALAQERGLTPIPPFDHAQVIAGQGSVGLEIAAQAAAEGITSADVLVCCGGGGLTAGIALALAERAPGLIPRPVEPEGFDDTVRSLACGDRVRNTAVSGLCDAILTPTPGELTFPILRAHCRPGLAVSDTQVLRAMALAARHLKLVLEPGGAVALAAALSGSRDAAGDVVIVVASGGNVDGRVLLRALDTGDEG